MAVERQDNNAGETGAPADKNGAAGVAPSASNKVYGFGRYEEGAASEAIGTVSGELVGATVRRFTDQKSGASVYLHDVLLARGGSSYQFKCSIRAEVPLDFSQFRGERVTLSVSYFKVDNEYGRALAKGAADKYVIICDRPEWATVYTGSAT